MIRFKNALAIAALASMVPLLTSCGEVITSCVAEGSRIRTPAGDVSVGELRVGDRVISFDPVSGRQVVGVVSAIRMDRQECMTLETGLGHELTVTAEHPVYSPQMSGYRNAQHWEPGMMVLTFIESGGTSNALEELTSVRKAGLKRVYDLTVSSEFHNFLANGILVHNKTPPLTEPAPIDDLEVVASTDVSLSLIWTAPWRPHETPIVYEVLYGPERDRFDENAVSVPGSGKPVGEMESYMLGGLEPDSSYFLGVRSRHEDSELWSDVFNVVEARTAIPRPNR